VQILRRSTPQAALVALDTVGKDRRSLYAAVREVRMTKLLRRIVPAPLYTALSIVKRHRLNQRRDAQLVAEVDRFTIDAELIENAVVLPDRRALLEHLPKGAVIAEIGVAWGEFSREILDICQPRKLFLIDLWAEDSGRYANLEGHVREVVERELAEGTAEILRGLSWEMVTALPDESLDFVYIDAAHDYESVSRDLRACAPKMAPGGIIGGHDYARWSSNGLQRFGVVEAVNEFANAERWELIYLTNEPGRLLSYGLRKLDSGTNA
jgi:predicted O-methyltransferase YrrM